MSALSEKVRAAIYTALNVSNITDLGITGVYHLEAPEAATLPYLVFNTQTGAVPIHTFGTGGSPNVSAEDDSWQIRVYSDHESLLAASIDKSPVEFNQDVLAQAITELDGSLSLSGGSSTWASYWIGDLPDTRQVLSDRSIFSAAFLQRIVSTA